MALHHYLPQDRLRALAGGRPLPEHTRGAALFADISGFTALSEALRQALGERAGIEALSRRINAAYDALIAEVERAGGSVIGFAGDAVTCWFDEADGAAAAHAVQAGRAMQAAMARVPDLSAKVVVASGPARRLVVGDPELQCLDTLAGPTLARVAAGDALARPGEVLLDEATARALGVPVEAVRRADDGACFVPLDPALALPEPPAVPTPPAAVPDAETLRPWVLPFVFDRETAGQRLFVTDTRPATALFMRFDADEGELAAIVACAQQVLQRHGGVLLELTIGDKGSYVYGCFGAARVHEDDPARALRAALALRQALAARPVALQFGVSSGTLRVGGYGGTTRQSFGALGDDVNTAARLMGLARPGEVLVSGRVRQAVGDEFALEARPPMAVKGRAEPVPVFAVLGAQQARALRLQEPASAMPLIGRNAEVALIDGALAAALRGAGRVLVVTAEAGMGKSRLVAEAARLARRRGFIGHGGACRSDGIATPYLVWHPVWAAFFDVDPALPLRRQWRGVEAELRRHAPEHADAGPLLGAALGLDWPDNDFTRALQPKDRKALLETVLLRCLEGAAQEAAADGMGLLVVLEDLHAADPSSLDLLARAVRAVEALPVLLLLTQRPADVAAAEAVPADWRALPQVQALELGPLGAAQVEQVLRARLAGLFPERLGAVPPALIARITERAQGNPYYVEELLNYLHDRGIDPRDAAAADLPDLPASLHALLLSRIDRLAPPLQRLLKVASVIGRAFRVADLLGCSPELGDAAAVQAGLHELQRLGLAPADPAEAEPGHLFRHVLMQQVAYESIALGTRERLHARYAAFLEARHDGQLAPWVPQLAHHYARAALPHKAALYLRQAGEQAAARYANDEALDFFERALQALPADEPRARFDLLLQREAVLVLQGRHDARRATLADADRLAEQLDDAGDGHAQVAVRRARLEIDAGDFVGARVWARVAIAELEGDTAGARAARLVDALLQDARALYFAGKAPAARAPLERALALARTLDDRRGEANVLSLLGLLHWQGGAYDDAEARLGEAERLIAEHGDARRRLDILNNLGVVERARARHAQALARFEAALAIARRIGDRSGEAMLLNNMGDVCLELGDCFQAAGHADQAMRLCERLDDPLLRGAALSNRAEAHRGLGQYAAAGALAQQALALQRASRHRHGEAVALDNLGLVAFALGRLDEATRLAGEAVALAREIGSRALEAETLRNLGRLHTAAARWADATQALDAAEALAREIGAEAPLLQVQAAQAERLLAEGGAGCGARALERLAALWPPPGADEDAAAAAWPMWLHGVAVRALQAAGNARAAAQQALALRELERRAARVPDAAARRDFLAVPEHRALRQA